jgi:hypothetical protein
MDLWAALSASAALLVDIQLSAQRPALNAESARFQLA